MLVAAAAAVALLAPQAAGQTGLHEPIPAPQHDPFYSPPDPIPDVAAGTVLRSRPVTVRALAVTVPVRSWLMLYRSTDTHGEPEAVSGTVLVADTPWTGGPRPLVTYAVGSHGLGPQCAPSYQMRQGQDPELGLISLALSRGWAVVVTDYEGSGTPGPHTYAAGHTTGQAVLDAARAAQRLPQAGLDPAGPVGVWGYSEGGIGASWAGELAPPTRRSCGSPASPPAGPPPTSNRWSATSTAARSPGSPWQARSGWPPHTRACRSARS
ncbi:MAG: hypothetical protein GEV09_01235 [Pseudonocardiaceae bacterium]|nr:hypothetical protein [Pseudonocardiaceae bacterium]